MNRAAAGALAVAVLAVFSSMNSYSVSKELRKQSRDPYGVESAMMRFAAAKGKIPEGAIAGYLSDLPGSETRGLAAFFAAQHALAPRLLVSVEQGLNTEWAVGNFARQADFVAAGAKFGYAVAADLGSGVVLYRKAKP